MLTTGTFSKSPRFRATPKTPGPGDYNVKDRSRSPNARISPPKFNELYRSLKFPEASPGFYDSKTKIPKGFTIARGGTRIPETKYNTAAGPGSYSPNVESVSPRRPTAVIRDPVMRVKR